MLCLPVKHYVNEAAYDFTLPMLDRNAIFHSCGLSATDRDLALLRRSSLATDL
jgi:hypothetical protein